MSLSINQIELLKDALNTFEGISFEMPSNIDERFKLIGKWQTIRRMLAELIYDAEYFEDIENSPYQLPSEWGEKVFLTSNKKPLGLIIETLQLSRGFSPALDTDAACFRVFNRMLAELTCQDLRPYRLLFESGEVTPKYCKDPILED